ncbi:MAG: hypothetical protein Q8907_03540 [Bacteroidota bacterium]|nr:hypothetical protein [Bacteroidota bacterium]
MIKRYKAFNMGKDGEATFFPFQNNQKDCHSERSQIFFIAVGFSESKYFPRL